MQKTATKKTNNLFDFFKKKKLNIKEIEKLYLNTNSTQKIGLEYERLSLDKNTLENASYEKLSKIIEHFSNIQNWDLIYDNETIIGAKSKTNTSISLEPGCQLEISLSPKENISEINFELNEIISLLDKIANSYDVFFLGYGISPKSQSEDIALLNKKRYEIMNNFLPYQQYGELCPTMMRKTAGIQINIDFKNKKDAYLKSKFLNLIIPFMCGLCANSPIENNILSKNKTNRAYAWLYTGKNRCNFFYQNVYKKKFKKFENFFKNYIEEIISIPMIFLERNNELIPINGKINFKEFINENYLNHQAKIEDYLLHQSLVFPDIRIKNYIEIRNHDSSNSNIALALCAFYKGLFKEDIENLLKKFDYLKIENIEKYNKEVIKNGLNFKINKNLDAWQVVEKLFEISKNNLSNKEKDFIKPLVNLIENKKTQADILIEQNITNAEELVSFLYE